MNYLFLTALFLMSWSLPAHAQNKPAYQLFTNQGAIADYDQMIADLANSDMVFFFF